MTLAHVWFCLQFLVHLQKGQCESEPHQTKQINNAFGPDQSKWTSGLSWCECTLKLRARFTISLRQHKPSFGVKKVLSGFTKDTQWEIIAEKAWTVIFCKSPFWICIFRSFPFDQYIYGRRVFKRITQHDLLRFALDFALTDGICGII